MASTEEKANIAHVERSSNNSANDVDGLAAAFEKGRDPELSDAHLCSEADNKRILRKTDIWMLSLLCMVYFLQSADKGIVGLTAVYGLKTDAKLKGNDYSNIGNIGYYAQLGVQPLAAWILVKARFRQVLPIIITCWGISVAGGLGASRTYVGLLVSRFFLGAFEAAVVPLFSVITIAFYRRSEQPFRIACWYGCYGLSTLISAPIVYGFGRVHSSTLYRYQVVYLFFGLLTIFIGLTTYWWANDSPGEARYLSPEDRLKAVDRLKANQQGIVSHKFNWKHVWEAWGEPKYWLYMIMVIAVNAGASVSSVFGTIILQNLAGFTPDEAVLLNMPFGAIQIVSILGASWLAYRFKLKSPFLLGLVTIVIVGVALMVALPKTKANKGGLLAGYYLLAFVYAINPLLISWMGANCAGQTKKAVYYTSFNAGNSIGNIITPYIFDSKFAPQYRNALKGILVIWCILWGVVVAQVFLLSWMQKQKGNQREAAGLPRDFIDHSMDDKFEEAGAEVHGENGLADMTDKENLYFRTSSGLVLGGIDSDTPDVVHFLGVPYAEPQIKARRWLPAVRKTAECGKFIDATEFGPACPQYHSDTPSAWLKDAPENQIFPEDYQDEDCLSVNVWAPWKGNATAPLPVIAWIHGGSFQTGAVDVPYYNPSRWVQRSRKHIVVGINYRLDIFGWPNATGLKSNELNLGYLDQRLAVEWIRDNIAKFGGDPERITLWGHSAGSVAVDSYEFTYPHDPIVNGLIMSSGTAHSVVKFAPANFSIVAEHFNCDTSNAMAELDCMRDVPFRDITGWLKQRLDNKTTPGISFTPVTDNRTSWDNFTTRALAGEFIRKPAIIRTTVNEWAPFLPYNATFSPNQTAADEETLGVFLCPSVLTAHERWAGGNATTFRYLYGGNFSNISPRWWQGAYHSADLTLIFGTHGIARGKSTPFEGEVSREMQDYFLAFAEDPVRGLPAAGWHGYAGDSGGESALFGWKDSAVRPISDRELESGCDEGIPNGEPNPPTS